MVLKPKHIGILACSAEGAALCYRTICLESQFVLGRYMHPEITLHNFPLGTFMESLERPQSFNKKASGKNPKSKIEPAKTIDLDEQWQPIADLMVKSAKKLEQAGAEIIICPDNTIHQAYDSVSPNIKARWLHIATVVASEALDRGFKKLGIMGTRYLMEGPVYPSRLAPLSIEPVIPNETQKTKINDIIFTELVNGIITNESKKYLLGVVKDLASKGCDAVVLGCTELPLIINDDEAVVPTLDSTRLLARAAIEAATHR